MLCQELADALDSLFVTWGFYFAMCETGEFEYMISKPKLPLNESKRRFWFVLHQPCLVIHIWEQLWRALTGVSIQGKELKIKEKDSTHLHLFFYLCPPARKPPGTL